jgi:hypothetical protein
VVAGDFDVIWSFFFPLETNSILVVDPNAELAFAIARKRFQPIAANGSQVFEWGCPLG